MYVLREKGGEVKKDAYKKKTKLKLGDIAKLTGRFNVIVLVTKILEAGTIVVLLEDGSTAYLAVDELTGDMRGVSNVEVIGNVSDGDMYAFDIGDEACFVCFRHCFP